MKNLKAKLRRDGGFTLVEMLIVVAIIAILIAVSIPMVGSALDRVKKATDDANERAAIGAAMVEYLSATKKSTESTTGIGSDGGSAFYVIEKGQGSLKKNDPNDDTSAYGKHSTNAGLGIKVTFNETNQTFDVNWQ